MIGDTWYPDQCSLLFWTLRLIPSMLHIQQSLLISFLSNIYKSSTFKTHILILQFMHKDHTVCLSLWKGILLLQTITLWTFFNLFLVSLSKCIFSVYLLVILLFFLCFNSLHWVQHKKLQPSPFPHIKWVLFLMKEEANKFSNLLKLWSLLC